MKPILLTTALLALTAGAALAEGDPGRGEKEFAKCKSCHSIISPDGEAIVKGGRTGPNLWGVIGRTAGTQPDFDKYGDSITALGQAGLVWTEDWTEDLIAEYAADPKAFLANHLGDAKAKSMMTFKLKDAANIAAYLAQFGATEPAMDDEAGEGGDDGETEGETEGSAE